MSKKTPLTELHLFPCIEYCVEAFATSELLIERCENYQKGSYRNRYYIASAQGPVRLSVPLEKGKHQQLPITEVRMDDRQNWRELHWRSICTSYGKSPFFEFYRDQLRARFDDPTPFLFAWNMANLRTVLEWLRIDVALDTTADFHEKYPADDILDLRNRFSPRRPPLATKDAIGGLYYEQVFTAEQGFQANLSILDLIFCHGPEAGSKLKNAIRESQTRMD